MAFVALIDLDLKHADDAERLAFDQEMADRHWTRLPKGNEGYCAVVEGCSSDEEALSVIEEAIARAATRSGIYDWGASCYLGDYPAKSDTFHAHNRAVGWLQA